MFWKLNLYFPNCYWFSFENFQNCPMHLVQDALLAIRNHQLEQANFNAIPISHLGVALAQINGAKEASCNWFNPFPRLLDSDKEFERTKRIFWELNQEQLVPSWVISLIDLDSFKG